MHVSDVQMLAAGSFQALAGIAFITDPEAILLAVEPATTFLERTTGLPSYNYKGNGQSMAIFGLALAILGYFYIMATYTNDERFKRNSTPGRFIAAAIGWFICKRTENGSSLLALFSLFNLVGGLLMAIQVGLGDGNAVQIELDTRIKLEAEKRKRAELEQARKVLEG